jgi:hypothetical protein
MLQSSDRIEFLGNEFESLLKRLRESQSVEDRRQLLRQMKVLIVEIDMVILSSLKQENHDSSQSVAADQLTTNA